MACCYDHDHDYCCRCIESDVERAHHIVKDVLSGAYDGAVKIEWPPGLGRFSFRDADQITDAIIAVLKHEDVI